MADQRRLLPRPHPGELQTGPRCAGLMRFDERFPADAADGLASDPAWSCLNADCRRVERVRDDR